MSDVFDELESFDTAYAPKAPEGNFRPGVEALPDGNYNLEITGAALEKSQKQGKLIFRLDLRVLGGQLNGTLIDWGQVLSVQQNADILGSTLMRLGVNADAWRVPPMTFSKGLRELIERRRLVGVKFYAKKSTEGQYARLYVNALLSGTAAMPAAGIAPPTATPVVPKNGVPAGVGADEDLPF